MDSITFCNMIISAANHLGNNKEEIDRLNVFPVPDGDTGKNMYLTMRGAADAARDCESLPIPKICEKIASATLKSARGNSGVILSQLFRGLSKGISEHGEFSAKALANGFKIAADTAYNAVMKPTEGTILTVARGCANGAAKASQNSEADITAVMKGAVDGASEALEKTPTMLKKLAEAGVVDAGGMGWLCILQGMYYVLTEGKIINSNEPTATSTSQTVPGMTISSEEITFGYCTEFIIEKKDNLSDINNLRNVLSSIGDSMLVIEDFDVIKVHVHTDNPGVALQEGLKFGSLINIKIDNMRHQHNENITQEAKEAPAPKAPPKPYAFVAVSSGEGFSEILTELGVAEIIEGGQTMNPSAGDIADAIEKANAETVYVFPNNKNIILAAEQSVDMVDCDVKIIPTTTLPQGISALISFDPELSADDNKSNMTEAAGIVKTGLVTYAVRDSETNGISIKEGDIIALTGKNIVAAEQSAETAAISVCGHICDEDTGIITIYYGDEIEESVAEKLGEKIEAEYPDCDVSVQYGGQPVYYYVISAE